MPVERLLVRAASRSSRNTAAAAGGGGGGSLPLRKHSKASLLVRNQRDASQRRNAFFVLLLLLAVAGLAHFFLVSGVCWILKPSFCSSHVIHGLRSRVFQYQMSVVLEDGDESDRRQPSFPSSFGRNENAVAHREHPCDSFLYPPPPPFDRKRTGPRPCPVCYAPTGYAMGVMPISPSESPVLKNLNYVSDETSAITKSTGGSVFGGFPSLEQRSESFDLRESMTVHCGFVSGKRPGFGTGFDIEDVDLHEMEQCHGIVVASAIFSNFDVLQKLRKISEVARRNVCFYMFVDEETYEYLKSSSTLDGPQRAGLWRLIIVQNLPYADPRRSGKIPKLLLHRLFPNARFSMWIDGKLELVADPYQILERFLWRKNATFAISRHYKRFDVFEEAEANKEGGKYNNASIDYQIEFYKMEGLTPYSPAKLPLISDVPEGCVILREHVPITNLFSCLWFNEVDRFTSRDQISFSTVRDKLMSQVNWTVDMFLDCERRNFVNQAYHRDILERMKAGSSMIYPPTLQDKLSSSESKSGVKKDSLESSSVSKPGVKKDSLVRASESKPVVNKDSLKRSSESKPGVNKDSLRKPLETKSVITKESIGRSLEFKAGVTKLYFSQSMKPPTRNFISRKSSLRHHQKMQR